MGLKARFEARAAAYDMDALFAAAVDPGERVLAYSAGGAAAHKRGTVAASAQGYVMGKLMNGVAEELAKARHIGGEKDSLARRLPRDGSNLGLVAVTTRGLSVWSYVYDPAVPPTRTFQLPIEQIAGMRKADVRGKRGYDVLRVDLVDGSFFDYSVRAEGSAAFFASAAGLVAP